MHSGFIPDMNVENGGVNSGIFFFFCHSCEQCSKYLLRICACGCARSRTQRVAARFKARERVERNQRRFDLMEVEFVSVP